MKLFICLFAAILALANASHLIGGGGGAYLNSGYSGNSYNGLSGLNSYGSGVSGYGSGLNGHGSASYGVERVVRVVEQAPVIQYVAPAPVVHHQIQQPVQVYKYLAQPTINQVPTASYVRYVNVNSAPAFSGSWKKK